MPGLTHVIIPDTVSDSEDACLLASVVECGPVWVVSGHFPTRLFETFAKSLNVIPPESALPISPVVSLKVNPDQSYRMIPDLCAFVPRRSDTLYNSQQLVAHNFISRYTLYPSHTGRQHMWNTGLKVFPLSVLHALMDT